MSSPWQRSQYRRVMRHTRENGRPAPPAEVVAERHRAENEHKGLTGELAGDPPRSRFALSKRTQQAARENAGLFIRTWHQSKDSLRRYPITLARKVSEEMK